MADKIYTFELTQKDLREAQKLLDRIQNMWLSESFYKYLGKILNKELRKIQAKKLSTIKSKEDIKASTYMNSNHLEITDGYLYIYNDAMIDITSKNMKETTKANYPAQLSLAKIVEYGIGYTGSIYSQGNEDWAYDVNNHGSQGWYYKDDNGEVHWTNGFAGRYVFLELKKYVEENIQKIMQDYFDDMLKKI